MGRKVAILECGQAALTVCEVCVVLADRLDAVIYAFSVNLVTARKKGLSAPRFTLMPPDQTLARIRQANNKSLFISFCSLLKILDNK